MIELIWFEAFDGCAYGDVARCEDVGTEAAAVNWLVDCRPFLLVGHASDG